MRNDVQQIVDILNSMNDKLGTIQSSIDKSGSNIDKASVEQKQQLYHAINEVNVMKRLLIKILGSLKGVSIPEVSIIRHDKYSSFDRELITVISFKSIVDGKEIFEIDLSADEMNKLSEITRVVDISIIDKEVGERII